MPEQVVGIAWYRAQDYREILRIMVDGSSFPATYRHWREEAELLESDLKRLGQEVVRPGDISDLVQLAWPPD
jgi:hypothetical protein